MATDWTAQAQAEVGRWVEAQQAWWEQLTGGQPAGGPQAATGADAVGAAVDAWREAAHRVVDAQAQALRGVLAQPAGPDARHLLTAWTDAQRTMWRDWLAVAGGTPDAGDDAGRRLVESLREAAEHLVRAQADWAKAWTDSETRAERPGGP